MSLTTVSRQMALAVNSNNTLRPKPGLLSQHRPTRRLQLERAAQAGGARRLRHYYARTSANDAYQFVGDPAFRDLTIQLGHARRGRDIPESVAAFRAASRFELPGLPTAHPKLAIDAQPARPSLHAAHGAAIQLQRAIRADSLHHVASRLRRDREHAPRRHAEHQPGAAHRQFQSSLAPTFTGPTTAPPTSTPAGRIWASPPSAWRKRSSSATTTVFRQCFSAG